MAWPSTSYGSRQLSRSEPHTTSYYYSYHPGDELIFSPASREVRFGYDAHGGGINRAGPPQSQARPRGGRRQQAEPQKWKKVGGRAKTGFTSIGRGYSRFQSLWGSLAFGVGILYSLRSFHDVRGRLEGLQAECEHAEVILAQLRLLLHDPAALEHLQSDEAGRRLLAKLRRNNDGLAETVANLRRHLRFYDRDHLTIESKVKFLLADSKRVSRLREDLHRHLDNFKDLIIWVDFRKRHSW